MALCGCKTTETDRFATVVAIGCEPGRSVDGGAGRRSARRASVLAECWPCRLQLVRAEVAADLPLGLVPGWRRATAVYRDGAAPRPDDLRYLAALTDLSSACRYSDDRRRGRPHLQFDRRSAARRSLAGTQEVTYFVATVGPDQSGLSTGRVAATRLCRGTSRRRLVRGAHAAASPSITPAASVVLHAVCRLSAGRCGTAAPSSSRCCARPCERRA